MKLRLFAIRDGAVKQFFPPACHQTPGEAQRWFQDMVVKPGTIFNNHPKDFALYEVGEYDTESGAVEASLVSLVVSAVDVLHEVEGPQLEVKRA